MTPPTITELLDAYRKTLDDRVVAAVAATNFIALVHKSHPDLLDQWLHDKAVDFVAQELTLILRQERARAVRRSQARVFSEAAGEGDIEAIGVFRALTFTVDDANTHRPLGKLTAQDLRYASQHYKATGNRHLAMASFLDALARKVGTRTVEEVYSEEEVERLLGSFVGKAA